MNKIKKLRKFTYILPIIMIFNIFSSIYMPKTISASDTKIYGCDKTMEFVSGFLVEIKDEYYALCFSLDSIKTLDSYVALKKYYFGDLSKYYMPDLECYRIEVADKVLLREERNVQQAQSYYVRQSDGAYANTETGNILRDRNGNTVYSSMGIERILEEFNLKNIFNTKLMIVFPVIALIAIAIMSFLMRRKSLYMSVIGNKSEVSIDELMRVAKTTFDKAEKEINLMIKLGIINGHIDIEKRLLIISKPNILSASKQTTNGKIEIKPCPTCGATNSAEAYKKGKCEYCGSPLSNK